MSPPFSLSLCPALSLYNNLHNHFSAPSLFPVPAPSLHRRLHKNSLHNQVKAFSSSQNTPNHNLEESRWLREEQRWLREEQRWLREERRWARERESLLAEIAQLHLQVQALERQGPIEPFKLPRSGLSVVRAINRTRLINHKSTSQVLKESNLIAESGSVASPMILEEKSEEVVVEGKVVRVVDDGRKEDERKSSRRRTLRVGAEGDEVKAMQVCLLFY